ncbi:MAG TPA: metal ABC transporter permease [Thermoanaerobaculia bacterium]|jgi:zinc transport system permease protein
MSALADALAYDFVRQALAAGLLASVLCGVLGTFVVVKRLVFISGGVSHAAFGGLGACHYLGLDHRLGAAAVAILAAVALGGAHRRGWARSHDAMIGILWAAGMALGIVFIAATPGYAPDLTTYLFGSLLTVGESDVWLTLALVVIVALLLAAFFKELVAVAFDEEFAAVQGVPVGPFMTLLMVLIALSVVLLIQLVGIILVIALLTIPPVIALMLVRSFGAVLLLSTLIGSLITVGGLALSYAWNLPSGPAIVLLGVALLPLPLVRRWAPRRRQS